eukprot:1741134-Rhodomonas_salina.6
MGTDFASGVVPGQKVPYIHDGPDVQGASHVVCCRDVTFSALTKVCCPDIADLQRVLRQGQGIQRPIDALL